MGYSEKVQDELASAQETAIANKIIDMLQQRFIDIFFIFQK